MKKIGQCLAFFLFLSTLAVAQEAPAALNAEVKAPFSLVAYGDIRFMNPSNTKDSDPVRRKILVQQIANEKPALLLITGDLVANGGVAAQWSVFDKETT